MANSESDMFGNSIEFMMAFDEDGFVQFEDDGGIILDKFLASDVVDSPAATDNLFKDTTNLGVILSNFLDQNPQVFEALEKDPSIMKEFTNRYNHYKSIQQQMTQEQKQKQEQNIGALSKLMGELKTEMKAVVKQVRGYFKKDIDYTLTDGRVLTVETQAEDPAVGDPVNISGETPVDGGYNLQGGGAIEVTGGVISAIDMPDTPVEVETVAASAQVEAQSKEINSLKGLLSQKEKMLNELQEQFKSIEAKVASKLKSIEELSGSIKSDGEGFEIEPAKKKSQSGFDLESKEAEAKRIAIDRIRKSQQIK
jgi:flagellar motility protein MotE (MotC chaperone)